MKVIRLPFIIRKGIGRDSLMKGLNKCGME